MPPGLYDVRPHQGPDGPEPGLDYWGDTTALDRLRFGLDGNLRGALLDAIGDEQRLDELLSNHKWQVFFEGLPIQDAADMVRFLLEVGCGFERFKQGTPQIGGGIDIAVVSRTCIHWTDRKPMTRALNVLVLPPAVGEVSIYDPPKR